MITWLRSMQGVVVTLAAAGLAGWGWVASIKSSAVKEERVRVERKAINNARKAETARRTADKLPPDRLRDKFCRDC